MPIEKDIVSRAIKGDAKAFAELYEKYFGKIYRYVYLRTGNQAEAEDLAQEVFVKAFEAIGSYRWRDIPFASWLFRIAHNQVVDHFRKDGKVERVELEDSAIAADEPSPALIAEQRFELRELRDNIGKLSPAQREVITLRFGAELSTAEVSEALGKNTGTVKALQYNGIVALRKLMLGDRER
jgi:RNA polymerase sigma-70 factor (ECF subfamily)